MQAACREAPTVEVAVRAREKRTSNIQNMLVTLDVSKLSGWLNADAYCRVKKKHSNRGDMRAGRACKRRRRMQRAGKAPAVEAEVRARAERTANMYPISVTLDVTRLNGWLNAVAVCRVKRDNKRGDMQAGRAWVRRRRRMQSARRARTVEAEGRARAERT